VQSSGLPSALGAPVPLNPYFRFFRKLSVGFDVKLSALKNLFFATTAAGTTPSLSQLRKSSLFFLYY
jgi:hypothetical protein